MRYYTSLLLILMLSIKVFSNTTSVLVSNIGNVYYSASVSGESKYQNGAIAFLVNEHLKKYFPKFNDKVFLELGFTNDKINKLSYNKFQAETYSNAEENRPVKGLGLRIQFSQEVDRAEAVLKLLEYGIKNIKRLKRLCTNYYSKGGEIIYVDSSTLYNIINSRINKRIKETLGIKVYRNLGVRDYNISIEYYFQNDKFYMVDFKNGNTQYLQLDKIYQIISDFKLGTLVFDTDSTLYFYNRRKKKLSDIIKIKNKYPSYYYKNISSDFNKGRIYFEYETYGGYKHKYILLSNELLLIQDVDECEDKLVDEFLNSKYSR